jgi:hypothetical protein
MPTPGSWWRCHVEPCPLAGQRQHLDPPRRDREVALSAAHRHYLTEHYRPTREARP